MTEGGILSIYKGRLAEMGGYQLRKGARGGGRGGMEGVLTEGSSTGIVNT